MSARRFVSRLVVAVGLVLGCWCVPALASVGHPFVSSFGSFTQVRSVAIDQATGDVYVFDTEAEKVLKYTATGEPAEFSSTKTNSIDVGNGGQAESEIAVDSSSGPAKGDIYVAGSKGVEIYNAAGQKIGALTEEAGKPWGFPCGVAVDTSGNVYVGLYGHTVNRYAPSASPVTDADYSASLFDVSEVCNVSADSTGDVYVDSWPDGPITRYTPSQFSTFEIPAIGSEVEGSGKTLTTDPADDHVYVDGGGHVTELGSHGEPIGEPVSTFGATGEGAIEESEGVAVNQTSGEIYVSNGKGELSVFGPAIFTPTVVTGGASSLAGHTATVGGSVNPEGATTTECKFEYGASPSYGHAVPCSTSPGGGKSPVAVTAPISGLKAGATYHFRLVASNAAGESVGLDKTFATAEAVVTGEASNVKLYSAALNGTLNPEGLTVTACEFEYGTTAAYGSTVHCANLPEPGSSPVGVTASISGLIPKTTYHYRLAVTDSTGESLGADRSFVTEGPLSTGIQGLPDGRVYEMVTPPENYDAEVYEPESSAGTFEYQSIATEFPFQAAADGSKVTYPGSPSVGGNENSGIGGGNQYLASRSGSDGWTQTNISPEGRPSSVFEGFSSDLSVGFLDSVESLSPAIAGFGHEVPLGGTYDVLYSTSTSGGSGYAPAFTVTPPYRSRLEFNTARIDHPGDSGSLVRSFAPRALMYAGASADSSRLFFQANDALTPEAEGGTASHYREENNLYESVGGQLRLVNVLPDGSTKVNATFGSPNFESYNGFYASPDFDHVISEDGARVFWTDLNTGRIYVRENGTSTVEISPSGTYWDATSDGSKVFYTNGDLYEYDVESGDTVDLTPGTGVQGVIGASNNGEYIYYVTTNFDLELWHNGQTVTIKRLSAEDRNLVSPFRGGGYFGGDWQPGFGNRMAEVTADGHAIVFMATGVEVYEADTNQLYCASCGAEGHGGFVPLTFSNTYMKRWISEGGSRVFFDSGQALVPQDTNGKLDAYEWERPGSGSCQSSTGCIYLLSGGTSTAESFFADASISGDDAFIVTRAKLAASDGNEYFDMYDARVDGVRPIAPPACTGTGCQGVPGTPPIFATPSSVTFNGVGNFATPGRSTKAKSKPKKKQKKPKKKSRKSKNQSNKSKARKGARTASGHKRSGAKGGRS